MITVANTANTNTWEYWINRTNELAYHLSTAVVTTDATGNNNVTQGNVIITGSFTANSLAIGNSSANLVIAAPNSFQIASGSYFLNANGSFSEIFAGKFSTNTTLTTAVLIDSFPTSAFSSVEYLIGVRDGSNSNFVSTKLHLLNINSDVLYTEYGKLVSNTDFATFSANVASSNVRIYMTSSISNTFVDILRSGV